MRELTKRFGGLQAVQRLSFALTRGTITGCLTGGRPCVISQLRAELLKPPSGSTS